MVFNPKVLLASQVGKGFVIIDEADQVLLDNAQQLPNAHVLALSATSFTEDKVFEKEYLERHKFLCINSKISGAINLGIATEVASLEKFQSKAAGYAKLIFDTDSSLPATVKVTDTNCKNLERLKQLTSNDVYLITEPELARGVDYRAASGTHGISLLVMSASKSDRAYVQLLGRVGRYGEPCQRFVWDQLDDPVDAYEQAILLARLRRPISDRRDKKLQSKQIAGQSMLAYGNKSKQQQ